MPGLFLIFKKTPDPTWEWWYLIAKQMSNVWSASVDCSSCNYHWCSHSSWVQLQSSWCKQNVQKRSTLSIVREIVIVFVVFEIHVYGGVDCEMQIWGQFTSRKAHSWIIKDFFSVIIMLVDLVFTNTLAKQTNLGNLHILFHLRNPVLEIEQIDAMISKASATASCFQD